MRTLNSIANLSATYWEEVWCFGSPKAQETVQKTQVILARKCAEAPWFIRNEDLRRELKLQDLTRAKRRREQAKERVRTHQAEGNERKYVKQPTVNNTTTYQHMKKMQEEPN
ncbi:hypothetical protein Trydic_g10246 [Trypoxylus dichotomus]